MTIETDAPVRMPITITIEPLIPDSDGAPIVPFPRDARWRSSSHIEHNARFSD
ncbi:MAG TPA: hypothetical protein VFN10_06595 [Thermoanaerobaculia bacterium]|nr:hypothetical protein [Thermoanaerobaculia bacterium]